MNRYLNAKNEAEVLALVQNAKARKMFMPLSYLHNKEYAVKALAKQFETSQQVVRAAACYW